MNEERLTRLADFLETEVPSDKFNLEYWSTGGVGECGTTACAFGWATKVPEFANAGLRLSLTPYEDAEGCGKLVGNVHYGEHQGFEAASAFFSITYRQASYLFYDRRYPEGQREIPDVVERIREFVENGSGGE